MLKPVAKLTCLEDSPFRLDRRLILAYLNTTYLVLRPPFVLRIGARNPVFDDWLQAQKAQRYAFLTAWNPRSIPLSLNENRQRNASLSDMLHHAGLRLFPASGAGDGGDWPAEDSFLILDISPELSVELGRRFEQNALVFGQRHAAPELWWL